MRTNKAYLITEDRLDYLVTHTGLSREQLHLCLGWVYVVDFTYSYIPHRELMVFKKYRKNFGYIDLFDYDNPIEYQD